MAIGLGIFITLLVGGLLIWYLGRCPHYWSLVKRGQTVKESNGSLVEEFAIYECLHCKKMKKETVEL